MQWYPAPAVCPSLFLVWDESWKKFTQSDLSQDFSFGGHTSYTWHKSFVVTWYLCMHTLSDYRLDNQCYYRSKRPLQVPKHLITHPITSWSPWGFWVIYTIISALEQYKSWYLPAFHTKVKWHGSPSVTSCPSIRDVKGPGSFPSLPSMNPLILRQTSISSMTNLPLIRGRPEDHSKPQIKINRLSACSCIEWALCSFFSMILNSCFPLDQY